MNTIQTAEIRLPRTDLGLQDSFSLVDLREERITKIEKEVEIL